MPLRPSGDWFRRPTSAIVRRVQLIQIGPPPATTTVQQLIQQMAAQQSAEIEQLCHAALARMAARKATSRRNQFRKSATRFAITSVAATGQASASL